MRVSGYRNEIDLQEAVLEQPPLVELAYVTRALELKPTEYPPEDELAYLRREVELLKRKDEVWSELAGSWAARATAASDVMAKCGFSNRVPCRNNLDILPEPLPEGPPTMNIPEVALGQSILEWVDYQVRSYNNDPRHQGKSKGELEQQLWRDLPAELKQWVGKPKAKPMAFLRSWYKALTSPGSALGAVEVSRNHETGRPREAWKLLL
jgi:hypothetical protein